MFMVLQRTLQELSFAGRDIFCLFFVCFFRFLSIYLCTYFPTVLHYLVSTYLVCTNVKYRKDGSENSTFGYSIFMMLQRTSQEPELSFAGRVSFCLFFVFSLPIYIPIYIPSYFPTLIDIYVSRYLLTCFYTLWEYLTNCRNSNCPSVDILCRNPNCVSVSFAGTRTAHWWLIRSKKISNDQELIQSDPISCPQNPKGNN